MIDKYDYFLIDVDRTLWDFDKNSKNAIDKLIDRHKEIYSKVSTLGVNYHEIFFQKYDVVNHKLWNEYEDKIITKDILRWKRFYDAFLLFDIDNKELAIQFGDEYLLQMIQEHELIEGSERLLQMLKAKNKKMAVVSNGFKEVQYKKLSNSNLIDFFQEIIISEEVGHHKPSPEIFNIALERLCGISQTTEPAKWKEIKEKSLMIGDDFQNDILGAKNANIDQCYLNLKNKNQEEKATYEVFSLLDIN